MSPQIISTVKYIPGPDTRLSFTMSPEGFDDLNEFLRRAGSSFLVRDEEPYWDGDPKGLGIEFGDGGGPVFFCGDTLVPVNDVWLPREWTFGQWLDAARKARKKLPVNVTAEARPSTPLEHLEAASERITDAEKIVAALRELIASTSPAGAHGPARSLLSELVVVLGRAGHAVKLAVEGLR